MDQMEYIFIKNTCIYSYVYKYNVPKYNAVHTGTTVTDCNICIYVYKYNIPKYNAVHTGTTVTDCNICIYVYKYNIPNIQCCTYRYYSH